MSNAKTEDYKIAIVGAAQNEVFSYLFNSYGIERATGLKLQPEKGEEITPLVWKENSKQKGLRCHSPVLVIFAFDLHDSRSYQAVRDYLKEPTYDSKNIILVATTRPGAGPIEVTSNEFKNFADSQGLPFHVLTDKKSIFNLKSIISHFFTGNKLEYNPEEIGEPRVESDRERLIRMVNARYTELKKEKLSFFSMNDARKEKKLEGLSYILDELHRGYKTPEQIVTEVRESYPDLDKGILSKTEILLDYIASGDYKRRR